MKCVYCLEEKNDDDFSLEHILPSAFGGKIVNHDLLRTNRVCKRCNNLCGLFVDSAFLKSWFSVNSNTEMQIKHATKDDILVRQSYIGICEDISNDVEYCDFWLWPLGSRTYNFYPRDDRYATYAGGNPINKKSVSFLMLSEHVASDKDMLRKTVISFIEFFNKSKRFAYNFEARDQDGKLLVNLLDDSVLDYKNKIEAIKDCEHKNSITIGIDSPKRFYSKLALGLGFNLLGEDFISTPYANELKKGLWFRPQDETPQIHSVDFAIKKNEMPSLAQNILNWDYGNILNIIPCEKGLAYILGVFGSLRTTTMICDNITEIKTKKSISEYGLTFLWSIDKNFSIGPIPFADYIAHRSGASSIVELRKYESQF